jgi:hypothetical protein
VITTGLVIPFQLICAGFVMFPTVLKKKKTNSSLWSPQAQ